uniref:LisH domain-containing protein C1711.05-like n=2 Tax=Hirondellea gigas TaxID=1518452 RepID=A0A6A7FNF9_9CRUS
MMLIFSPQSLEAQKLISVSIGKINASRVTRTGSSLHKSLLVASVLHKARNVYLDEERERAASYPQCPPLPSELTITTPVCRVNHSDDINNNNDKENRMACREDEVALPDRVGEESRLPLGEANTGNNVTHTTNTTTTVTSITNTTTITTTSTSQVSRKRRRVSDQETAAAISSILPKRLRSELREESLKMGHKRSQMPHDNDNNILRTAHKSGNFFIELKPMDEVMPDAFSRLSASDERELPKSNPIKEYYTLRAPERNGSPPCLSLKNVSPLDPVDITDEDGSPPEEHSTYQKIRIPTAMILHVTLLPPLTPAAAKKWKWLNSHR